MYILVYMQVYACIYVCCYKQIVLLHLYSICTLFLRPEMQATFVWHLVLSKSQVVECQFHRVADMLLSTLKEEMYALIHRLSV